MKLFPLALVGAILVACQASSPPVQCGHAFTPAPEAIVSRWGRPGVADYLTNLISLSKDDHNSDVSSEMMAELLMLQDVASVLEETETRDLSFR